uniref:Uncharacterized protein n=3 Tax=Aegilops tauschii subsp. strangulata TaxID=200361 RepID=A0A453N3L5_AEGTS
KVFSRVRHLLAKPFPYARPSPTRSSSPTTSSRIPIDGRSGRSAGTDGVPPARCRSSPSPAVVPPQPQVQRPPLPPAPLLHPLRRPSLYIPREGREGNGPDRGSRDEVRQRPDPRRHRRAVVDLSRHRYRGQPWRGGLTRRQPWMETPQTLAWGPSRHGCSNEEGGQRPGRRHGLTLLCSFPTMTTPWKVPSFSLPLSWKVFDLISNWAFICVTAAAGFLGGYISSRKRTPWWVRQQRLDGRMDATMEAAGLEAAFGVGDGMRSRAPCATLSTKKV